ncbi:MAG TPA: 2-polyprenyl-3-methyl-6-methoxy-1,4-benzoquinone monooxygenase [Zoogloea sp.]|uniref:2-polyprenyl-3-methyl-6-methoxy-1,4-benzoquinone monooxygenase n=1 Tax=Zoogloea sp. TaxID=49181 RepID=UPI002CC6C8E2|nr:2-polyprenyl-3-methyl-6-methoxy-1,4-benzoquinone monooxygenase [Zoogloea sp.]HMV17790.1 2-polyprenyl-3-methyl-6-methoxy-1,4-benzoquinone monooxygenase [Rhodocyclaceae bacterium]HMZ76514.1 2-polyprenyl-3-methyl-6-methoxy-1,4-benzoquinone monooxygenase [Rhodocyclaceae bacterium]HNA68943.1 2-polyprenyl-3-methyl-6-methoxy-1,4-benzoquinone monooxygenase [Rhodocyclaceae bacterium]HNB65169.1 2-polyprenyl-3-methyl-6-methoxy-1,4-benzoquinone monooxygenase [Rhodocyclaceae bacterium]HNC79020.1 2-polyp
MIDQLILGFDRALQTVFASASTVRPTPGEDLPETELSDAERRHAAALMRINHCGEICAQALYQGQALMSDNDGIRRALESAAQEETEHLAWTERRIAELGGRKSLLNPLWYGGSLAIGMAAAKIGDGFNLGFLAETERQVEAHLKSHLDDLPQKDGRTRAIIEQMKTDEVAHAETAVRLGAVPLPPPVRGAMKLMSRVMTRTAYWL